MSNAKQIEAQLEKVRRRLLIYKNQWPTNAGGTALKFIDSNFSAQGWQGNTLVSWKRTKSGKRKFFGAQSQGILINRGRLRGSFMLTPGNEQFKIFTRVKYAAAHNNGFKGTVNIPAHTRKVKLVGTINGVSIGANSSLKTKRPLKNKTVKTSTDVKAHKRKMNLPQRQFMPTEKRGSHILLTAIKNKTQAEIQRILSLAQ